jgi:hypothetical protein
LPLRPECANSDPEQLIDQAEAQSWSAAIQYRELLTEGEVFKEKVTSRLKEPTAGRENDPN